MHMHIYLALVGICGGLIAGTVGLAGGIFLVPAVVTLLGPNAMGEAVFVSFFAVLLNSLTATWANRRARGPGAYWELVRGAGWFTAGAGMAALVVTVAVGRHPDLVSRQVLAMLQLMLALCMLVPRTWYEHMHSRHLPAKDAAIGSLVGGASALIGVGGGTYTMLYFLVHGRQIKDCTLTANFVGIFIGLMGIVGYFSGAAGAAASGMHGAIDTMDQAMLVVCGALASPLGVRLQATLPAAAIKRAVVLFLALSSGYALWAAR